MSNVIVVNRGKRTYQLAPGANGKPRLLPPGGSIEVLDETESKLLLRFHDVEDINTVSPQLAGRIESHEREIERLKAENARLIKQRDGIPAPKAAPAPAADPFVDAPESEDEGKAKKGKKGR